MPTEAIAPAAGLVVSSEAVPTACAAVPTATPVVTSSRMRARSSSHWPEAPYRPGGVGWGGVEVGWGGLGEGEGTGVREGMPVTERYQYSRQQAAACTGVGREAKRAQGERRGGRSNDQGEKERICEHKIGDERRRRESAGECRRARPRSVRCEVGGGRWEVGAGRWVAEGGVYL